MPRSQTSRQGALLLSRRRSPVRGFGPHGLTDPDGYRIELVQWPPGHPAGMTAADFAP